MSLTQFDIASAGRIANVVRAVEGTPPPAKPLTFGPVLESPRRKLVRMATFTGAWSINSSNTVTFRNQTATPNTASVVNLFFPITRAPSSPRDCAIAKDGTAWYLIDVPLRTATAVFVTSTSSSFQVSDVNISASLNTSSCAITIGKTLTTSAVTIITGTATAEYLTLDI